MEASPFLPYHLTQAAACGDVDEIRAYLEGGGHVNRRCLFQSQMLHIAAREGQAAVTALLLDNGAAIDSLDYAGMRRTALHWACQQGHVRVVELLVEAGANTKAQGKAWSMLVQGQRCGRMIDTEAPFSRSPASLCKNDTLRLALERPPWSLATHPQFPLRFRQATKLLLLMGSSSSSSKRQPPVSAPEEGASSECEKERGSEVGWQLPRDVVLCILSRMAYPISAWVQESDFEPPGSILR